MTRNRSLLRTLLAAIAGALVGASAGWLVPESTPDPDLQPVLARDVVLAEPLPAHCPDRHNALRDVGDGLVKELEMLDLQLRIIEHRREQREGVEMPWPSVHDPLQAPATLEGNVAAALDEVGGELLELECDEYPCLVSMVVPADEGGGVSSDALGPFLEALHARGYADHTKQWNITTRIGEDYAAVIALWSSEEDISGKRVAFRGDRFGAEIFASLREEGE